MISQNCQPIAIMQRKDLQDDATPYDETQKLLNTFFETKDEAHEEKLKYQILLGVHESKAIYFCSFSEIIVRLH
jgi:hypothetical protein